MSGATLLRPDFQAMMQSALRKEVDVVLARPTHAIALIATAPREIASIKRRSQEVLKLLLEGFRNEEWKNELRRLDERRGELEAAIAAGAPIRRIPRCTRGWPRSSDRRPRRSRRRRNTTSSATPLAWRSAASSSGS